MGAIGAVAGGLISGGFSARQAAKQRDFQERMYKNRYQYQVADLKKAGLNPALAYGQSPGGAPSGAMGQIPDLGANYARGTSAASEKKLRGKQGNVADAQQGLIDAQTDKTRAEATKEAAGVPGAILKEKVLSDIYEEAAQMWNSAKSVWKDPLDKLFEGETNSAKDLEEINRKRAPGIDLNKGGEPSSQIIKQKQFEAWQKRKRRYKNAR